MNITYIVTVCNEIDEFSRLIKKLKDGMSDGDNIFVQYDEKNASFEVKNFIYSNRIDHVGFPLDGDFAEFKNNTYKHTSGDWLFFIDADEYMEDEFFSEIHEILTDVDPDIEAIAVPRINIVHGITDEYVKKWGWRIEEVMFDGNPTQIINFPDYQWRIQRNVDNVRWHGQVHETLKGFKNFSVLPQQRPYCLIHEKSIEKQIMQNSLYESI